MPYITETENRDRLFQSVKDGGTIARLEAETKELVEALYQATWANHVAHLRYDKQRSDHHEDFSNCQALLCKSYRTIVAKVRKE